MLRVLLRACCLFTCMSQIKVLDFLNGNKLFTILFFRDCPLYAVKFVTVDINRNCWWCVSKVHPFWNGMWTCRLRQTPPHLASKLIKIIRRKRHRSAPQLVSTLLLLRKHLIWVDMCCEFSAWKRVNSFVGTWFYLGSVILFLRDSNYIFFNE